MITMDLIEFAQLKEPRGFVRLSQIISSYYSEDANNFGRPWRVLLGFYSWIMKKHGKTFYAFLHTKQMRTMSRNKSNEKTNT